MRSSSSCGYPIPGGCHLHQLDLWITQDFLVLSKLPGFRCCVEVIVPCTVIWVRFEYEFENHQRRNSLFDWNSEFENAITQFEAAQDDLIHLYDFSIILMLSSYNIVLVYIENVMMVLK